MSKTRQKLSSKFVVEKYQLQKIGNNSEVRGKIIISGRKIGPPSKRFVFNQKGLKIDKATITHFGKHGTENIKPSRINHHQGYEEVRLHYDSPLYAGKYEIVMEFHYKDKVPAKDAELREIFPSIDENDALKEFEVS
jgi:hypothetical protein